MFSDAAAGERSRFASAFDVCIVGAGPAGITLARALAARGFEVALMEGGGFDVSVESQDAYVGDIVGMDYIDLDAVRLRVFGGCSEHWSGRCRAIDAEAFEPMPQRPMAWPIRKADLDPYAVAAAEILDLPLKRQPDDLPDPDPGPFRDIDDRGSTRHGAHRTGDFRSSQAISCSLSSTPRPRVDERISAMLRGPNSAKVGNLWWSTKARAIAVAGTPRSAPSCSARARRSKFSSL